MSVVRVSVEGGIASIVLVRPPVNALDEAFVDGFAAALDEVDASRARVIVVRAEGTRAFCAGGDIAFIEDCVDGGAEGRARELRFVGALRALLLRLERHPAPSIAVLDAAATGGGLELALACDLRVVGNDVRLGLPEVRIGLLPGAGGTQRLTRIAGPAVASRLVLTSELVDGRTAHALGIVQYAVRDGHVQELARQLARGLAEQQPTALALAKRCIAAAPSERGYHLEVEATAALLDDPDTGALLREFLSARRHRSSLT